MASYLFEQNIWLYIAVYIKNNILNIVPHFRPPQLLSLAPLLQHILCVHLQKFKIYGRSN